MYNKVYNKFKLDSQKKTVVSPKIVCVKVLTHLLKCFTVSQLMHNVIR